MPFNPTNNAHVMTGDDAFYGDGLNDDFSPLTAFWNFVTGATQQQQLQSNEQEFQEYIYNHYNSPAALVRQFHEAGVNTNLLGSTSFGTAQGAASSPSVNPMVASLNPNASQSFKNVAEGLSSVGDVELKNTESDYYRSLPSLNKALEDKYGSETGLNNIQFDLARQTFDWQLMNSEFSAKSMREGYYIACSELEKSWQEYDNLVLEGKLLNEQVEREKWEKEIKHKTFDILVEHGYLPDANYLDKIYQDFVYNRDYDSFNRFVRGYELMWNGQNRSSARFGAYGNSVKIAGVEVPIEYLLQTGMDLADVVRDIVDNGKGSTRFGRFVNDLFKGSDDSNRDSSSAPSPSLSSSEMSPTKAAQLMWQYEDEYIRSHPYGILSKRDFKRYLVEHGFSSEYLNEHWSEIWFIFDKSE